MKVVYFIVYSQELFNLFSGLLVASSLKVIQDDVIPKLAKFLGQNLVVSDKLAQSIYNKYVYIKKKLKEFPGGRKRCMTAWEFTAEVSEEPLGRVVHHHFWFHPRLCVCLYACVAGKKGSHWRIAVHHT